VTSSTLIYTWQCDYIRRYHLGPTQELILTQRVILSCGLLDKKGTRKRYDAHMALYLGKSSLDQTVHWDPLVAKTHGINPLRSFGEVEVL